MVEVNNDISKYEDFLENVLQKDLSELMKQKQDSLIKIQEIQKLRRNISLFSELGINELNTRTNLGCDLYVDTLIPNINKICVELSFGFFIELNLSEVPYVLDLKEEFENSKLDKINNDISTIKSRIRTFIQAIKLLSDGDGY